MENLKDVLQDDLRNAFFDLDEFAETHTIDGKVCSCVIADMTAADAKMSYGLMKSVLNPKETAINKVSFIIYVRDSEIQRRVTSNSVIDFDGKKLFVQNVSKTDGVYEITVGIHGV